MEILVVIGISALTAIVSLGGGFLLLTDSKLAQVLQKVGPYVAVTVMLYAIFAHLAPEAAEVLLVWQILLIALGAFGVFMLIGWVARHFHKHGDEHGFKTKRQAIMMVVVDSLHAVADGVVLGVSFSAGLGPGVAAATATVAHEVPQEIGDFAIMLRSKMPKRKVAWIQIVTALILVPVTVAAYFMGDALLPQLPYLLAAIIGFFLYIICGEIILIVKSWQKS